MSHYETKMNRLLEKAHAHTSAIEGVLTALRAGRAISWMQAHKVMVLQSQLSCLLDDLMVEPAPEGGVDIYGPPGAMKSEAIHKAAADHLEGTKLVPPVSNRMAEYIPECPYGSSSSLQHLVNDFVEGEWMRPNGLQDEVLEDLVPLELTYVYQSTKKDVQTVSVPRGFVGATDDAGTLLLDLLRDEIMCGDRELFDEPEDDEAVVEEALKYRVK